MTLTYMFWQLAKNPALQDQLRKELRSRLSDKPGVVPSYNDVVQLPLLNAIVYEALRLHPAAPASLPRETPQGGKTLNGYFIPETVSDMKAVLFQTDIKTKLVRLLSRCNATPHSVIRTLSQILTFLIQRDGCIKSQKLRKTSSCHSRKDRGHV